MEQGSVILKVFIWRWIQRRFLIFASTLGYRVIFIQWEFIWYSVIRNIIENPYDECSETWRANENLKTALNSAWKIFSEYQLSFYHFSKSFQLSCSAMENDFATPLNMGHEIEFSTGIRNPDWLLVSIFSHTRAEFTQFYTIFGECHKSYRVDIHFQKRIFP